MDDSIYLDEENLKILYEKMDEQRILGGSHNTPPKDTITPVKCKVPTIGPHIQSKYLDKQGE